MEDLTDLRAKRRERLVSAAKQAFIAQGYRAATMEGIAAAASVSKATLYSYFPDKPAIFDAVAQTVAKNLVDIVESTLESTANPVDAVIAALTAKHMHIHSLVRTSGHADELFRTKDAVSAHHFENADSQINGSLARRLSDIRDDSEECIALLTSASQGIANAAPSPDTLCERLDRLRVLIEP